jgi:hypothetical protein
MCVPFPLNHLYIVFCRHEDGGESVYIQNTMKEEIMKMSVTFELRLVFDKVGCKMTTEAVLAGGAGHVWWENI